MGKDEGWNCNNSFPLPHSSSGTKLLFTAIVHRLEYVLLLWNLFQCSSILVMHDICNHTIVAYLILIVSLLFVSFIAWYIYSMADNEEYFSSLLRLQRTDLLQCHRWLGYPGKIHGNEHRRCIMCFDYEINSLHGIKSLWRFSEISRNNMLFFKVINLDIQFSHIYNVWLILVRYTALTWIFLWQLLFCFFFFKRKNGCLHFLLFFFPLYFIIIILLYISILLSYTSM